MITVSNINDAVGRVIRDEAPYVKVLSRPRLEIYEILPGVQVERYEAVAQVDGMLAVISLTVTPMEEPKS